jgi:hypothetical protein
MLLLALAFMLYLAPGRRRAALLVVLSAFAIGVGVYAFILGLTGAPWVATRSLIQPHLSLELVRNLKFVFADGYTDLGSYVFVAFVVGALTAYGSWSRAQYFGNTAPLLISFSVVLLFALVPAIHIWIATLGLVFVFVFVGGVAADLLETRRKAFVGMILAAGFLFRIVLGVWALKSWVHNP